MPLLSTVDDRVRLMREGYGIQEVVVASFDAMQRMAWEDFVSKYLAEELGAVHVVAGSSFFPENGAPGSSRPTNPVIPGKSS